ncbi:MAG: glycoside hydrolase family 92 protein [Prolixibacteraceae bacterium]|nr:glycoside hydrolase family 92 protein [Prolixibacteraceae bacterium]MBT6998416.1 glycoside hydrolase family 92 protein [Prolixibacteraceae bacterium]MBT7397030.1 glycoside hydrolase family 92 protein [Prolixibacteraceae bacterium]
MNKLIYMPFLLLFWACSSHQPPPNSPTKYVDPLIGAVAKTKYYGRTFPGSTLPYSLVKLGPDTYTGGDVGSGYSFEHETLEGFSFVHMSGIGWFGDFGNLLVTPTNGKFHPNRGSVENPKTGYRSKISHETEIASPGFYAIDLDDYNIKAEMTSTLRTGILRFTFPENKTNRIQIDLARRIGGTSVKQYIKVLDDHRIEGWMKYTPEGGGWGNGKTNMVFYTVYFSAEFSKPFSEHGIWSANIPKAQSRKAQDIVTEEYQTLIKNSEVKPSLNELEGEHLGFYAEYPDLKDGDQILFKAGISFVDQAGARNNLKTELNHWDFNKVLSDAENAWTKQLDLIKIEGATEKQKEIFYTSMYHAQMDPRDFTDVDGRFYLKESGINEATDFNYRTIFSGWDAFRSHIPLLTIIDPNSVNELVNSLIAKGEDGGMGFPKWEIAGCYSNCMLGDPALPVILDAWTKGIRGFDLKKAYGIGKQTSLGPNTIRNGWENYNEKGYVACDPVPARWNGYYKGVSATLENCYADWCISQIAKELNDKKGEQLFSERAKFYKNIFDAEIGYFRGKYKNGDWIPWEGELVFKQGNIESNPLQQMWFVPHDIPGLKSLIGEDRFLSELENMFDRTPADFPFNEFYNHANEPVHHVPYLFNYTTKPWLTQKWVRTILENAYDVGPYGIMGNDDVGQMSAWYILSAMGFHPVCQGDNKYMLGSPLFSKVEIKLDPNYYDGKTFKIIAINNSSENIYVQKVSLNGNELKRPYIFHDEITKDGELVFEMGSSPNKELFIN